MLKGVKSMLGLESPPSTSTKRKHVRANSLRGNFITKYTHPIENDYEIDSSRPLGTGAFGVVVAGMHIASSRPFAIKFINKFSHLARIEREIKLMTDIDHANIIRLFSVYDSDSQVAFVMERCTGGHLGQLLKRTLPNKYLEEAHAKVLIRQLVSAVAHIHSRGICHRDIEMQNILLENLDSNHAQIKLIDFGFATRYVGVTPMKTRCGTPYSTAPEVYRECYDERCDVWSVGIVTYVLLSGHRPFSAVELPGDLRDAGKAAMTTNILMGRYHFNYPAFRAVSPQGISFIQKLLTSNYKNRCSSKDAFSLPWLSQKLEAVPFDTDVLKDKDTPLSMAVSNLRGKRKSSVLGNTGMVAVAFHHSRNDAPELRSLFQTFDTENLGVLSKDAFRKAMKSVSPDLSFQEIDQLFEAIDVDDDKQISFTEFLAATMDPREVDTEELSKAFKLLDSDNKGYLTVDDFYRVLSCNTSDKQNVLSLSTRSLSIRVNNREINLEGERQHQGSSEDISKSGFDEEQMDGAGQEREKAILLKKIARMITAADMNNDGVLSYAEFLVGIVGLDGNEADNSDDDHIDASAAISLLSEQRDVFSHSTLHKNSEKIKLKNLLGHGDIHKSSSRGGGSSGELSGASTSDRSSPRASPRSPTKLPVVHESKNVSSSISPTPKLHATKTFVSPLASGETGKMSSHNAQSPQRRDETKDAEAVEDYSDKLSLCSTLDVGMMGSFIRLQSNSSLPTSPMTPTVKGPPVWIANSQVLAALNRTRGAAMSPVAHARIDKSPPEQLPPI